METIKSFDRTCLWAVLGSMVLAVLPFFALWMLYGPYSTPPEFMDDSGYYYGRMETIAHGHPFFGNPYFKEHAGDPAVAFFGADWIAAAPLLTGAPLLLVAIADVVFWTGVLCMLCIALFRTLGLNSRKAALSALAIVIGIFWYMERPVSMQIVFPSFAFMMVAFAAWLEQPSSRKRSLWLTLAAALTFYLYTYEWQVTALVLFCTHFALLRDWRTYRKLLLIDAGVFVLALPMFLYTIHQLLIPTYWETVRRISLVSTHTIGSAAAIVLAELLIGGVGVWLIRDRLPRARKLFFGITGLSIGIASVSNVITGKDMETAVHVGLFMSFWVLCAACVVISETASSHSVPAKRLLRGAIAGVLFAVVLVPSVRMTARISPAARAAERYVPVFAWLRANTAPGSVVQAPDAMAYYFPSETQDYALFQPDGGLHLLSDSELEDRYLASRSLASTSLEQVEADYRLYAGAGNAIHAYKTHNREAAICRIVRRTDCSVSVRSAVDYRGEGYFASLLQREKSMQTDPLAALKRFDTRYVIVPSGEAVPAAISKNSRIRATVSGFDIYELTALP